eukprot:scaffold4511_cov171-Amphora_coffeaeformis.AAC.40
MGLRGEGRGWIKKAIKRPVDVAKTSIHTTAGAKTSNSQTAETRSGSYGFIVGYIHIFSIKSFVEKVMKTKIQGVLCRLDDASAGSKGSFNDRGYRK